MRSGRKRAPHQRAHQLAFHVEKIQGDETGLLQFEGEDRRGIEGIGIVLPQLELAGGRHRDLDRRAEFEVAAAVEVRQLVAIGLAGLDRAILIAVGMGAGAGSRPLDQAGGDLDELARALGAEEVEAEVLGLGTGHPLEEHRIALAPGGKGGEFHRNIEADLVVLYLTILGRTRGFELARRVEAEAGANGFGFGRVGDVEGQGILAGTEDLVLEDLLPLLLPAAIVIEIDPGVEETDGGGGHDHGSLVAGDQALLIKDDAILVSETVGVIAAGLRRGLAVGLGIDELAQAEIADAVPGAVTGQQGRKRRIGGIAKVKFGRQDLDRVILHLAVAGGAGKTELGICAEAEAGEGEADPGVGGKGEREGVRAGLQGDGGEDLFAGIGPAAIGIEIDPGIEVTGPGGGDAERNGRALGQMMRRGEEHSVFVIAVEVVAAGIRVGLAILLLVDPCAEETVAGDDMARAVVLQQGRVGGIRGIAEIPVDADRLDLDPVIDAAVGADLKADLEALASGLGGDLGVREFIAVGEAELRGKITLALHKAIAVGIGVLQLGARRALLGAVEPLDQVVGESGHEFAGAIDQAPLHLGPDIFGVVLPIGVGHVDFGDDILRLGSGIGSRARGYGFRPVGQTFWIVPPDRRTCRGSQAGQDEKQAQDDPARCIRSLVFHQLSSLKMMTPVTIELRLRRRHEPPARL